MKNLILTLLVVFGLYSCHSDQVTNKPNVVIIYVDDLGYGDVGAYGATQVSTPHVDKLANNGILFTDGHCTSATCTPSRYSLLTGSYAFRNDASILQGNAPLIISEETNTMADMLHRAGYKTGVVGKWHLGLGNGDLDWNGEIAPGPLERGFDYSFLIPATGDRVPCVYVENHRVVGLDPSDPIEVSYRGKIDGVVTGLSNPELLRWEADRQHAKTIVNGVSRIGYQKGGKSALWKDEDFPEVLTGRAIDFIEQNKEDPFFLFFSFHDIHVPRVPNERFVGKTDMGPRGDAIVQMDWMTGELIKALEERGLAENTLIIFSSDNGPILDDGYGDEAVERLGSHQPAGPYRGAKYSVYEAGTRVPTIAYWPDRIAPGKSDALVNQVDLFATIAKLVGVDLEISEAPDSFEMLDAWLGESADGREYMIEEGLTYALRWNDWKFIKAAPGKRDWTKGKKVESGVSDEDQLYNLSDDPGEQRNVISEEMEVASHMRETLEKQMEQHATRDDFK